MADLLEIPLTFSDASFKIRAALDTVQIILHLEWNDRAERWHFSLYSADETPLILGLPMCIDTELIQRFKLIGLPPGQLFLFDVSDQHLEAGRYDLGDRCRLFYMTAE